MRMENPREGFRQSDEHTQSSTVPMRRTGGVIVTPLRGGPDAADPRALLRSHLSDAATRTVVAVRSGEPLDSAIGRARANVRCACDIARMHGVGADQVVVLMREESRALTSLRFISRADAEVVLARLVTLCILTYYSSGRS